MVCLNRRLQRRLIQERLGQNRRLPTSPGPSPAPPRRLPAPEGPARGKRNTQKRRGHSFTVSVHFFAVEPEPAKQNIKAQAGDFAPRNLADPSGPRLARFCFHFTGEKRGSGGTSADSDPGLGLCPRSPLGLSLPDVRRARPGLNPTCLLPLPKPALWGEGVQKKPFQTQHESPNHKKMDKRDCRKACIKHRG